MKKSIPDNKKTNADKTSSAASVSTPLIKSPNTFPVVGIGASAGGLDAFKKLIKAIPENSGMAFVLVQHLDPKHESLLPELLQKVTKIPVLEITDDIKVQPDHIYVIPSNKMMVATDGVLLLAPRPAKSKTERNLPIDLFFTSLAEVHEEHAIGVVLSGTASDGTQGLKAIKEHGGITFAQDEASAEYDGMPHSAAQAGVVDFILPPGEMPKKLLEVTSKTALSDEELQNIPKQDEDVFKQILSLLRIRKGVDFTYYKQTTVRRRILRRMVVNKNEEPAEYLKFLRGNNQEQDMLYQDILIPVTSFFRDKKTFDKLCNHVFPTILKNKIPGEITRIWVAGCSTGQEAYSFAICFKEFLGDDHERIQIFGTDLSEPSITKARTGLYEKSEVDGVSPERLKEYFTKNNGGYQINKSIRNMCVFAHHNFLKDPPFGKMDVISCRNVLIYMEPFLQKKALTTFHYALNPKGFLLLGKSETTGGVPDLFAAVEKNDKLYTRKDVPGRFLQVASQRSEQILNRPNDNSKSEPIRTDFQKTADDILLTKYTPAGVVVNEAMDIVHFRGNTANYLEQAPGKPSHNLLMMAKNGLGFELRNILHKAKTDKVPVVKENIPLSVNGHLRHISIEAVPLPNTLEPYYLILFHDNSLTDTDGSVITNRKKVSAKTKKEEKDIQIQLLEQELAQAREDMRSITEDQEASNEELQSANEELLSGSEELQSLNEELETSKEELQSTNEELTVLNHELISLNEQVTDARNYSESIVATLYQPLLVLDKHLRVKTANKAFYKTFKVNEQETEGVLIYDLGNRQWNIPELRTLLEEILPQKTIITDFEVTHNFSGIGERIILLSALEITREKKEEKLILLSIEDITDKKKAENKLRASEQRFRSLVEQAIYPICILKGENMIVEVANEAILEIWGVQKEVLGKPFLEIIPEMKDQPFMVWLHDVYKNGVPHYGNEEPAYLNRKDGSVATIYFNFAYQPYQEDDGTISGVMVLAADVTEQVLARKKIEESEYRFHELIYSSPSMMAICKGENMIIEIANDAVLESWGKGKDVIGKSIFLVLPETVEQGFDKLLLSVYKTGEPVHAFEAPVILLRNGTKELVYYNFIYQAQRNVNGVIEGVAIIAAEVTPQALLNKKIKESEAFNRAILESSPDCIKMLDGEGRLKFMNSNGICLLEIDDFKLVENTYWWDMWEPDNRQIIKDAVATAKNGEKIQFQLFGPTAKGTPKWWDIIVSPVQEDGADKNLHLILSVSRDITKQKLNELKEMELLGRFQNLVMQAPVAICVMRGKDYVVEVINEGMREMWDRKIEDIINKPAFDVLPEFRDQGLKELLDSVYNTGERVVVQELPLTIRRHRGMENIFVKFVYEPLREGDGTISGVMSLAHEITEQVIARKKIEESETKFRTLIEDAPVATCLFTGREMRIEVANDMMIGYWGKGKKVIGKPLADAVPELKGQPFLKILDEVFTTGKTYEAKNVYAQLALNGVLGTYYFDFTYKPLRNAASEVYGIMDMAVDVTEQVLSRKKIEESEAHFRLLADLMPAKISNANADGTVTYFNKEWLDFSGLDFEELRDFGYHKLMHPDEVEEFKQRFQKAAETGTVLEMEMRFLNKEGKYKWHLNLAAPVKDENGNIKMWVGVTTEIQQQKEQEGKLENAVKDRTFELLEANEELVQKNQEIALSKYNKRFLSEFSDKFSAYKGHNEFFSSLVLFISDTTHIDYVFVGKLKQNENGESSIETIALSSFGNIVDNITYPLRDGPCEQVIHGALYSYPNRCRQQFPKNKTIERFNVEGYIAYPLNDEMGDAVGLIAVMHQKEIDDAETISSVLQIVAKRAEIELERIRQEELLVQHNVTLKEKNLELKKMNEELASFTYISSHDLQEPLRKIQTLGNFIEEKEKQNLSSRGKEYFIRMQESAKRMRTLIDDLLAYSGTNSQDRIFENTDLKKIIDSVIADINDTLLEKKATIDVDEMCAASIIPFQFHQLFTNLIGNSLKFSIPGKPAQIIIRSKTGTAEELCKENNGLNDRLLPDKAYCHLSITDNGIGFDPEYKERIFSVFQRLHTKDEYPGTGIGLAIVKKIVDNHNGFITASGKMNEGARFDIYIPAY